LAHFFAVIDPTEVQQMIGAAAAVCGFDLDALAPFGQRIGPSIDAVAASRAVLRLSPVWRWSLVTLVCTSASGS
jgi:hypothetical protein